MVSISKFNLSPCQPSVKDDLAVTQPWTNFRSPDLKKGRVKTGEALLDFQDGAQRPLFDESEFPHNLLRREIAHANALCDPIIVL